MSLLGVFLALAPPVARTVPVGRGGAGGGARGAGPQLGGLRAWARGTRRRGFVDLHQLLGRLVKLRGGDGEIEGQG